MVLSTKGITNMARSKAMDSVSGQMAPATQGSFSKTNFKTTVFSRGLTVANTVAIGFKT